MKTVVAFVTSLQFCTGAFAAAADVVGDFLVAAPNGYHSTVVARISPPDDMIVYEWQNDSGGRLTILYWTKGPKIDRGKMVTEWVEDIEVAGVPAKMSETKVFIGTPKRVLVTHPRIGSGQYVIFADQMTKAEFVSFLDSMKRKKMQANQALQTTPMVRNVYVKTIEFGYPQRGV